MTVARIPPVMTTVPAVIRMALHQHPAESKRREGWEERTREREKVEWSRGGQGVSERRNDGRESTQFISAVASLSRL